MSISSFAYAVLEISTDKKPVSFGLMDLGEEKELGRYGGYHHEITARSTNDNTWHLKINIFRPLTSGEHIIPLENFKWRLVSTDGRGALIYPYQYKEFSLSPELIYTSMSEENNGTRVKFRFKYLLKIPEMQVRGSYTTVIRFTITEML